MTSSPSASSSRRSAWPRRRPSTPHHGRAHPGRARVVRFGWEAALLLGTALSATDPAVVFSALGKREVSGQSGTIIEGGVDDLELGEGVRVSLVTRDGRLLPIAGAILEPGDEVLTAVDHARGTDPARYFQANGA